MNNWMLSQDTRIFSKFENSLQKDNDMNLSIDEEKALTQFHTHP
jgi:hypothetical protein